MKRNILLIISIVTSFLVGMKLIKKIDKKIMDKEHCLSEKYLALFLMMNQWVRVKQEKKNIADYLEKNGYKNIAIYGMSHVGVSLLKELKNSSVSVKYGIDERADEIYSEINIISPDDFLENVDVIIVTPIFFMEMIVEKLTDRISCPIISLETILNEI